MAHPIARRIAAAAALTCAACGSAPPGAVTNCQTSAIVPGAVKTDILFVVDDSGSMAVEQTNLAANFKSFIDALAASPVKDDFQIGITTTSVDRNVGSGANLAVDPTFSSSVSTSCPNPVNGGQRYPAGALVAVDAAGHQLPTGSGRILPASSATLTQDFQRNVNVGTCGSGKEQGLRAAQLALSEPLLSGANAGFLRPGSRLAVVIVSDDDDCSDPGDGQGHPLVTTGEPPECEQKAEQVGDFVQFLKGPLGGEARDVVVAVIAAVDPVTKAPAKCTIANSTNTAENAAPRYVDFATAFGAKSAVASICDASFGSTLQTIAGLIATQTVPLSEAPADWRLLAVSLGRAAGTTVACRVGLEGDASAASADVVYAPPQSGRPASLTFQRGCALAPADDIHVQVLCAG